MIIIYYETNLAAKDVISYDCTKVPDVAASAMRRGHRSTPTLTVLLFILWCSG